MMTVRLPIPESRRAISRTAVVFLRYARIIRATQFAQRHEKVAPIVV